MLKKFQFEYVEGSVFERSEANENRKARRCHKKLLLLNLKGRLRRNVKLIPEPGKFHGIVGELVMRPLLFHASLNM
jgi:hypothetical protein